jgi:hypothetical protein
MSLCLGAGSLGWSDHIAAHYAPGYFARVAMRRQLPQATCYVASPQHDIGSWLLVEGVKTGVRRRCLVADTSQPWDRQRHVRTRLIELDYDSAGAICGSTRLPNRDCPVRVGSTQSIGQNSRSRVALWVTGIYQLDGLQDGMWRRRDDEAKVSHPRIIAASPPQMLQAK